MIIDDLHDLRDATTAAETSWAPGIGRADRANVPSAVNLAHYWALRQHDLRGLQHRLAAFGLSSLARSQPHVRASLDATSAAATALAGSSSQPHSRDLPITFGDGSQLLRGRTIELLGPEPARRGTRIMVTLPPEAATQPKLLHDLVDHGMDLARINCAHDGPAAWTAMIANVRAAAAAAGRPCRIAMDLAGPKLRTGPLAEGPRVVKIRPTRDTLGRVTAPATCWLTAAEDPHPAPVPGTPAVPVPQEWLQRLREGDMIRLRDARDSTRHLVVDAVAPGGARVSVDKTTYIETGVLLHRSHEHGAPVGLLPALPQHLTLHVGDLLVLTRDCAPAPVPPQGLAHIGCTLAEVFGHVLPGQPVHLDDGMMSGVVVTADDESITLRITDADAGGTKLREAKGINLPETALPMAALTDTDRRNLAFVAEHADLVEMSFVRSAADVEDLLTALDDLGATHLGVVVKLETVEGFGNLPAILLALLRHPRSGVMIARGDLAVEAGYERMAELQEEILWLCEAAHLPVVWATQVLDQLARTGRPSRAEITDAAMGERAECVMLNKGPHIVDAVDALADILQRMRDHHDKGNTLLRPLRSWAVPESTPLR